MSSQKQWAPFIVVLLAACYRYAPVNAPAVTPASHVRLALAEPTAPAVRRVLGDETIAVEGRVIEAADSAYTLAVAATLKRGLATGVPTRLVWADETVIVPRSAVSGIELRSLDRGRTTRAMALGTVAALVAVKLIVTAVGSSSGGDDGGPIVTPP